MINKDDILTLLATGKSVDEIAAEMADTLNAAKIEHDERVAREVEEMKRLSAESEAKREAVRNILSAITDYVIDFTDIMDEMSDEEKEEILSPTDEKLDELVATTDELAGLLKALMGLKNLEFGLNPKVAVETAFGKSNCEKNKITKISSDDVLKVFLNGMGW